MRDFASYLSYLPLLHGATLRGEALINLANRFSKVILELHVLALLSDGALVLLYIEESHVDFFVIGQV